MKVSSILVVSALLLGCAAVVEPSKTGEENKAVVRAYMERLINNGEWTAWGEFFNESVSFNGREMTRTDMEGMAKTFGAILEGYRLDVEEQIGEADVVATRVTVTGKHTADYMGLKASGKDLSFRGIAFDRIEDGKVVEMWHEMDIWGTLLMASDE